MIGVLKLVFQSCKSEKMRWKGLIGWKTYQRGALGKRERTLVLKLATRVSWLSVE